MGIAEECQREELLEAHSLVWNQIFSFVNSGSLRCAVQLGIPDVIHSHGKPMALGELVAALPIKQSKAHGIHRLMRVLVNSGFFAQRKISQTEQEEGYVLTPASQLLLKNESLSVRSFALMMFHPALVKPWDFMSDWFQSDDTTPFHTANMTQFWEYMAGETSVDDLFNEAMADDSKFVLKLMLEQCKGTFEGLRSLVDVGGGTGTVARAITESFSKIKCTVLDLPQVVANCQGSEKLDFVGGSMFESIPPANAILLKEILHMWDDEACVKTLKKCKEAIPSKEKGGKVIVIDIVLDNKRGGDTLSQGQLFLDMIMLAVLPGKERTKKDWAKLFSQAGFSHHKITPALGLRSLIEAYP